MLHTNNAVGDIGIGGSSCYSTVGFRGFERFVTLLPRGFLIRGSVRRVRPDRGQGRHSMSNIHTCQWCEMCWLVYLLMVEQVIATSVLDSVYKLLQESDNQLFAQMQSLPLAREYDWVIVGGGTAGCTLASRLSEVPHWQVLLLEAGGLEGFFTDVPVLVGNLQKTKMDWQYRAEPIASSCRGYENGQCYIPRGKVLGGSSVLNYMLATRGNRLDYDQWEALGNPGWGYKDVLPYFIKAENISIDGLRDDPLHGLSGPLTVSHSQYRTPLLDAFLQAGRELGHIVGDYNGANQNHFSPFQFTKKDGRRSSNSRAYLYPVLNERNNLHIRVNALVTKLIIEEDQVQGVIVEYKNSTHEVLARKEVALTAGAVNTPQILMLSGIGPRAHLQNMSIEVVRDLPVGRNLQDHVSFAGLMFLTNITSSELNATHITNDSSHLVNYVNKGFGPYEIPGGNEGVFFYDTSNPNGNDSFPDIEIHFSTVSPIPEEVVRGFKPKVYNTMFAPFKNIISWAIQPIIMHPKSRGFIELRSKDPHDLVKITTNYFQHHDDVKTILKGIHKAFQISRTRALQRFQSRLSPAVMPGCERYRHGSDPYWRCTMRQTTITNYHQTSSCTMAPDGVVDSRLKVHGIQRLRIIDASIMPLVPTAHTNIPTNMVAEKGADLIKEDYKEKQ